MPVEPKQLVAEMMWLVSLGFTTPQVQMLYQLRLKFRNHPEADHPSPKHSRRQEFIRWLVQTGRLREF